MAYVFDCDDGEDHSPCALFKEADGYKYIVPKQPCKKNKPTYVIWDWDNCTLPDGSSIKKLRGNIQVALKKYDAELVIKTFTCVGSFFGLGVSKRVAKRRQKHLRIETNTYRTFETKVRLKKCYKCGETFPKEEDIDAHLLYSHQDKYTRVKEIGDAIMSREMMFIHMDVGVPGVMVLISQDVDFENTILYLVNHNWRVIVVAPDGNTVLKVYSRAIYTWEGMQNGDGPSDTRFQAEVRMEARPR